jgi:peptide/nickel transport system substrate-binding protein
MTFLARQNLGLAMLALLTMAGCGDGRSACRECGTVVVAAIGEPTSLVPPLVFETVGRDISDQVFERLANLAPGAAPIDLAAYRPGLADRWERIDSLTWRFHLRPGARWHDGRPVTAEDVVFSFGAFSDSTLDAAARSYLAGRVRASAEDSATVRIIFTRPSPDQLYDATYHVRILPRHVWDSIPRSRWAADTTLGHLVGSGPYRMQDWRRGQFVKLVAESLEAGGNRLPAIRRVIWRFAADPDAALNLILSQEADLMETAVTPDRVQRVLRDTSFRVLSYPSAVYGFLAFRVADAAGHPHPVLGNREVRRALAEAVDRPTLARALFGEGTKAPPGPMSQLLWIWDDKIQVLPFDSAHAREVLARARAHRPLGRIDILVPSTSSARRQLAQVIQEAWRKVGVPATVTIVEFPVFQERLAKGRFDSYIGAYLDEPSPRSLADQWSRGGWGALNYGRYANPVFDSLLGAASRESDVGAAKRRWREAMDTLNADAPAIFLYAPANNAVIQRRLEDVKLDPYSWASGLSQWRIDPNRALARDSVR